MADIRHTFSFSTDDLAEMEWEEMCRWHCQHLRITEEQIQLMQLGSQMASAATMQQAFGGEEPQQG